MEKQTESLGRDFVLARLAAARSMAHASLEAIDATIESFIDITDLDREQAIEAIIESLGSATRAIECAQAAYETLDKDEREDGEPDYDEVLSGL